MNEKTRIGASRKLTGIEFRALGFGDFAYVRPERKDDIVGFAIHAADGRPLGFAATRALAFAAARFNDLEPLSVH